MSVLYNCRTAGESFRITKFGHDLNVESSYLCTASTCECPRGGYPTCRHREMLPRFQHRKAIDTRWWYDFDRGGWVQMEGEITFEGKIIEPKTPNDMIEVITTAPPKPAWRRF
jgi:hypothetical protein